MEAAVAETNMLIKSQLIGELSKNFPHLPEKDIALAVNHIIEHMSDILSEGGRIEIQHDRAALQRIGKREIERLACKCCLGRK